nr:MAG TPA: hypothetical protein [Herelleviridae sp.]
MTTTSITEDRPSLSMEVPGKYNYLKAACITSMSNLTLHTLSDETNQCNPRHRKSQKNRRTADAGGRTSNRSS